MKSVKVAQLPPVPHGVERHVLALVGRLQEVARQTLLTQDWGGLRPSHFRLLSHVPSTGITITELASALHMTKQGVGQFVTQLQGTGHLEVNADGDDRRRRVVRRTPRGDRLVLEVDSTIAAMEHHWQQQVGAQRYRAFRQVLEDITNASAAAGGP
jgi:DNA-binding MarR family transcriptional regulator